MLYITFYAFFRHPFYGSVLICHIMPPLPQDMEISSGGLEMHEASCKVGQTGQTPEIFGAQAKWGNCKGFGGALQSLAGRSMGRWVDGDCPGWIWERTPETTSKPLVAIHLVTRCWRSRWTTVEKVRCA